MSTTPPVLDHAVGFVAALREAGLVVPLGSSLAYLEALDAVDVTAGPQVYWTGRATLVPRIEDVPVHDQVFRQHWLAHDVAPTDEPTDVVRLTLAFDDPDAPDEAPGGEDGDEGDVLSVRFSAAEVLRRKDFADYDDAELAEAQALMARLAVTGIPRRSRRRRPVRRAGVRPDLRRTVRRALQTGGEPIERRFSEPGRKLRRLVFLLDVSGSMEPYARALIRFVHAAVVGRTRVEAFALGTRLTRLTRQLSSRDPDQALTSVGATVEDWSGGTRLGETIGRFNDVWGCRGMARGAVVVILSDGWDRGDPAVMAEQMARLGRVAHKVIWVNPLKASPGYQPLAGGMAAALPHVDEFVEGHSIESLEHLADLLS